MDKVWPSGPNRFSGPWGGSDGREDDQGRGGLTGEGEAQPGRGRPDRFGVTFHPYDPTREGSGSRWEHGRPNRHRALPTRS